MIKQNTLVSEDFAKQNRPLQIVICDDEEEHNQNICRLLSALDLNVPLQLQSYVDAVTLLEDLKNRKFCGQFLPDIIFCDIKMPEMDGISLGKEIRKLSPDIYLILLTAYAEYAIQGYETGAFRYLLKPVSSEEISQILCAVIQKRNRQKKLIVRNSEQESILPLSEIIYLSSEDKYSILYTRDTHYVDRTSLNDYEMMLRAYGFCRIHRKYIVNISYHKGMGKGKVVLTNGTVLPVSRRKEAAYRAALLHHLEEELL